MTTSGTTSIDFEVIDLIFEGYERAGYDPQELNAGHMRTARRSLNLIMINWANKCMLPFAMDMQSFTAVDGQATYSLPADTVDVLPDVSLRRDGNDTPITRISRQDYENIPDKDTEARPDRCFIHRLATPVMYLWPVPENSTDTIRYWRVRRLEDVTGSTETVDVSFRWLPALVSELAVALYEKKPEEAFSLEKHRTLLSRAAGDFHDATLGNAERASLFLVPMARHV